MVDRAYCVGEGGDDLFATLLADDAGNLDHRRWVQHRVEDDETGHAARHETPVDEPHEIPVLGLPGDEPQARADQL